MAEERTSLNIYLCKFFGSKRGLVCYFAQGGMQTRLRVQYNGIRPISLVYVSKPLITVT